MTSALDYLPLNLYIIGDSEHIKSKKITFYDSSIGLCPFEGGVYLHRTPSRPVLSLENVDLYTFGCGFDWLLDRVFFTYNGKILDHDFSYSEYVIFPTICFKNSIDDLFITFDLTSFKFDVESYVKVFFILIFRHPM